MNVLTAIALAVLTSEEVSVKVTVSNFYHSADGKRWESGSWELACGKGEAIATVHLVLDPGKGGEKRQLQSTMDAKEFDIAVAELKKKGLFTLKDSQPCACDAPQFTVTVKEGKTEHSFKFTHAHDDHDKEQKELIDKFITIVEKAATRKPHDK